MNNIIVSNRIIIKDLFNELIMTSDPITANKVRDIEILIEKYCDEMKTQISFWKKQHKIASDDWLTEAQNGKQLEESVTELKKQLPKVVTPIKVSRDRTFSTGFPFLAWTCPECGCRKQVGSAERDDTPIGDKFCSCGVKLNWEEA